MANDEKQYILTIIRECQQILIASVKNQKYVFIQKCVGYC